MSKEMKINPFRLIFFAACGIVGFPIAIKIIGFASPGFAIFILQATAILGGLAGISLAILAGIILVNHLGSANEPG